jgi:hypothetical protein
MSLLSIGTLWDTAKIVAWVYVFNEKFSTYKQNLKIKALWRKGFTKIECRLREELKSFCVISAH